MRDISILGIPMDLGAGRRGVDMGPSALRLARLADTLAALGHTVRDHGNVDVPVPEELEYADGLRYRDAIADACRNAFETLRTLPAERFPIVLGGDHSVSMGSVAGVAAAARVGDARTGVLWIDAHADLNTPATTPSGNVHGMPLAHLLGFGDERLMDVWGGGAVLDPRDVAFIGLRSVDPEEREFIHRHDLKVFTMKEIDRRGIGSVAEEAIEYLAHVDRLHVSFDADALEPGIAPGVGTPVSGGLSYREAHLLMELLADAGRVTSLDLVEVNPILDRENHTARIMVEMTASLLGKSIV